MHRSVRLLVFALVVVAHGDPALNLDDWSCCPDVLPWSAWSADQAWVHEFDVTPDSKLYVKGEIYPDGTLLYADDGRGNSYGRVGFKRTLYDVDLSPYAAIAVSYETIGGDIPLAVEMRLQSPAGDYSGALALTPREGVAFVGPLNVTTVSKLEFRIMAQEGPFAFRLRSISAVSDMEEFSVNPAPIDGESPNEVAAYVDQVLERGAQLVEADLMAQANAVYRAAARAAAETLLEALPAPGPTQARNALLRGLEAAEASEDDAFIFGELHSALEAALFAASSATEDDFHGWPADDASTTPWPSPLPWRDDDDDDGEKKYKTGFRFARCDGGSSRCILMIIYFVLLAASFCLCGFCLRDFCRQYWNRRKTIPYTDEDPVPGTVGDAAAAPPDAAEDAASADEGA